MKKAYLVWGEDDLESGVHFVDDSILWDHTGPFGGPVYESVEDYLKDNHEEVIRVPDLDAWVEQGTVPVGYLIQFHNWCQECSYCETLVDSNEYDIDEDRELYPVYRGQQVFCCPECESAYDSEIYLNRSHVEDIKRHIKSRWPFVADIRQLCSTKGVVRLELTVPGLQHDAEWSSEDPDHVLVKGQEDANLWRSLSTY